VFVLVILVTVNDEHLDCAVCNMGLCLASGSFGGICHLQLRYCNICHVFILLVILQAVFINNKLKPT